MPLLLTQNRSIHWINSFHCLYKFIPKVFLFLEDGDRSLYLSLSIIIIIIILTLKWNRVRNAKNKVIAFWKI